MYNRLIPRNETTIEGRRHANALPIQSRKPQNDEHQINPDSRFAFSQLRDLKELATVLGNEQVCVILNKV